jgi:hypothetical protein
MLRIPCFIRILICLILFQTGICLSQTDKIDSMKIFLGTSMEDTTRIKTLARIIAVASCVLYFPELPSKEKSQCYT